MKKGWSREPPLFLLQRFAQAKRQLLRAGTACNSAITTTECPSGGTAIGVTSGQLKCVRASRGTRGNTGRSIESWRGTRR